MLSVISHRRSNTEKFYLAEEFKVIKHVEVESRMAIGRDWEKEKIGCSVWWDKVKLYRWLSFRDLLFCVMLIVNHTLLYTEKFVKDRSHMYLL